MGVDEWQDSMMPDVMERYSRALGRHAEDRILDEG
jgi:hypothetical protein